MNTGYISTTDLTEKINQHLSIPKPK